MDALPQDLAHLFLSTTLSTRAPAYLFVASDHHIVQWGGQVSLYGLDFSNGPVDALHINFLAGLFPLQPRDPLFFPCVETTPGVFADVHIFPSAGGNWVLLLDETEAERHRRQLQQQINGLKLHHANLGVDDDDTTAAVEVISALEALVLERKSLTQFRAIGIPPTWVAYLGGPFAEQVRDLSPTAFPPFLANFLIDAEEFWQSHASGRLQSGLWSETALTGEDLPLEASALLVNGRQILVIERAYAVFGDRQALVQRARENNLILQRLVLETQKKEVLLHCIVHDLVQPLTGMKGCLTLLHEELLNSRSQQLVTLGMQEAQKQEALIHDILYVFAAEMSGSKEIQEPSMEAPDLGVCIREAVESYTPAFTSARVQLVGNPQVNWEADWHVVGERSRLDRILANLLENALRYSPYGSTVTIGVQDEGSTVLATVDDEGPGIAEELRAQLFQKFVRGKTQPGKVGLGLYFCRITVESWGGTIGCSPRETGGTRFWFRLPRPLKKMEQTVL